MKRIFLFFVFLLTFFCVQSGVIITHGAFGQDALWFKRGGYFFDALSESADVFKQKIFSFSWKQDLGGITHEERLKAGVELAKTIVDLIDEGEKEIILIGHSFGGHVIKVASQILAISLGLQDKDKLLIVDESDKRMKPFDLLFFKKLCEEFKEYLKGKFLVNKFSLRNKTRYIINTVYTLGTPNNIPDYLANMDVIEYLCNFYSDGDLVQDLVGDKLLPEPRHKRTVNLSIKMKGTGWFGFWGKPNHLEMHAAIIGKWILSIPFFLKSEKIGNFDRFDFNYDGQITFSKGNPPIYYCNKTGFKEDGIFAKYDLSSLKKRFQVLGNLC